MDRFDEKKHDHIEEAPVDRDHPAREGDILGLGGSAVPKSPGDPTADTDPASAARRRARMREDEAADDARGDSGSADTFGSTSIDMGAGGTGNTVTRK